MVRVSEGALLALVLIACTELAPGSDLRDAERVDARDGGRDAVADSRVDAPLDACPGIPLDGSCPPLCARVREVLGDPTSSSTRLIAGNTRLTCDRIYSMPVPTFVEPGVTLTVDPGVVIEANSRGYLVVEAGARLIAEGTSDDPIVFTSAAVDPAPGDWGGLLLFGHAPFTEPIPSERPGFLDKLDPARTMFGGDDSSHDCGSLRYVRIEYGGKLTRALIPEDFNVLVAAGCGTDTQMDYLQLHANDGEATRFFGGGFAVRHMIISEHLDDGLGWNMGWNGSVQFLVVHNANDNDENSIEGRVSGNPIPSTGPPVANATLINSFLGAKAAVYMTAASGMQGYNILIWGSEAGIEIFDSTLGVSGFFDRDYFTFENSIVDPRILFAHDDAVVTRMAPPMRGNRAVDPELDSSVLGDDLVDPSFRPAPSGPASEGAAVDLTFLGLETTDYVGAVDPDPDAEDWTQGWTRF